MRSLKIYLLGGLLLNLLVGCSEATSPPNPTTTSSEVFPTDSKTPTPIPETPPTTKTTNPTATPTAVSLQEAAIQNPEPLKTTQYNLTATLDYANHHLSVEERIDYTNQTNQTIPDLLLVVEPMRYPGVFQLNNLRWGDGSPINDYTREIGLLRIPLEDKLEPGETAKLQLIYELQLPSPDPTYYGRPVPFGYSTRQTNLVDWYPFMPPYTPDQGWLVNNAGPFGEHLVYEIADYTVRIRISDANPSLLIAASAPAEVDPEWHHYHLDKARNFVWSASDQYVLSTTTVDGVLVMAYTFPLNAEAGEAVLRTTADALELYNQLFGLYEHQTLTVVEADFLDGMEYDGLYFLSKGFYNLYSGDETDYLTAIAAHETAHQWWYGAIGNNQALEPWLDEALCTYSERLFYEHLHSEDLDWWWTYRVYYYEPSGWVDGSIYNPEGYLAYRNAVYLNGALFFEELRSLIGEQTFIDFLQAYVKDYRQKIASGDDFFALLTKFSQENLTPLLDRYFQHR